MFCLLNEYIIISKLQDFWAAASFILDGWQKLHISHNNPPHPILLALNVQVVLESQPRRVQHNIIVILK